MTTAVIQPDDALPLLAYKIAPRQFDLSYRFSNISLRDQIVRGQTLVRTLFHAGLIAERAAQPHENFELLICGAGAAGLAAAKEAHALGISFILIEKGGNVPGGVLTSGAQRYVSAAMYEWPHPNHAEHAFPLSVPVLLGSDAPPRPALSLRFARPERIATFGNRLKSALRIDLADWNANASRFKKGQPLAQRNVLLAKCTISRASKEALKATLNGKVSIHGVPLCDEQLPAITLQSTSGKTIRQPLQFRFVIYAVGFAAESVYYADKKKPFPGFTRTDFWKPDTIFDKHLGLASNPHVGILGSGDGALQDALRCLVSKKFPHPLAIWQGLLECKQNKKRRLLHSRHITRALAQVAAADGYTTAGAVWTAENHVFASLDAAFEAIIDELIVHEAAKLLHAVESMVRTDVDEVTVVTRYGYFSKAYALNRFLVLLFHKVLRLSMQTKIVRLKILGGKVTRFDQVGKDTHGARIEVASIAAPLMCNKVIIRGGLSKSRPPFQQAGLTGIDTGRAELGRIPAPIRAVSIDT